MITDKSNKLRAIGYPLHFLVKNAFGMSGLGFGDRTFLARAINQFGWIFKSRTLFKYQNMFTETTKISKQTVQYFIALAGNYCPLFHLSEKRNIIYSKTDSSLFDCPCVETIVLYSIYPA